MMLEDSQKNQLESKLAEVLFDLGKEIKILKIDKDNIILDVPYTEYIKKIINIFHETNNQNKKNV